MYSNSFCTARPYDPKAKKAVQQTTQKEEMVVSPLTGELIAASKLDEHIRITLLDPKWKEQKARCV